MLKLRGHHLLCLNFFKGEGYNRNFVDNLRKVLEKAKRKEFYIAIGSDDICIACSHLKDNKCNFNNMQNEEKIKGLDTLALNLLNFKAGERIMWSYIDSKLPDVFTDWRDEACSECQWLETCSSTELWRKLGQSPPVKTGGLFREE